MPNAAVEKMEWFVKMSVDLSGRRMAMVLIVGGSETTASTLSAIIWYLIQNVFIYRTFVQEIRDT
jgi:cytochrome P450